MMKWTKIDLDPWNSVMHVTTDRKGIKHCIGKANEWDNWMYMYNTKPAGFFDTLADAKAFAETKVVK